MLPFQYIYLLFTLICFIPWFIFYLYRKDLRREMLVMSIFLALYGVFVDYAWYTVDWWQPQTITGTRVGIESFLLGFTNGGVISVLYSVVFNKKSKKYKKSPNTTGAISLIVFEILFISALFWVFRIPSPIASSMGIAVTGVLLVIMRKDLLANALMGGLLTLLLSLPIYYLLTHFYPHFAQQTYLLDRLSGLIFIGIPVEDFIFYFLVGFLFAPFYKFWQNERLVQKSS